MINFSQYKKNLWQYRPLVISIGLIVIGLLGIALVKSRPVSIQNNEPSSNQTLPVIEADGSSTNTQQSSGQLLQNSALTQDIMEEQDVKALQQGGNVQSDAAGVNQLLENVNIQ